MALGPNGHRGVAGDHARRRPEAERCEGGDLGRQGERGGVREHPQLTRSSMARTAEAEEVGRRRFRPRQRRRVADVGGPIRPTGGVPASAAGGGERGARGGPGGGLRFAGDGRGRRQTATTVKLGFGCAGRERPREGGGKERRVREEREGEERGVFGSVLSSRRQARRQGGRGAAGGGLCPRPGGRRKRTTPFSEKPPGFSCN